LAPHIEASIKRNQ